MGAKKARRLNRVLIEEGQVKAVAQDQKAAQVQKATLPKEIANGNNLPVLIGDYRIIQ